MRPSSDSTSAPPGSRREEASACAAIVDLTRESEPVRMPAFEQAADGWRALADQAGALREELTDVREEGPAGDGSLLPASSRGVRRGRRDDAGGCRDARARSFPSRSAAPSRRPTRRSTRTSPSGSTPRATRPRLTLLGPVNARAYGEVAPAIAKRKPYFVETARLPRPPPRGCHRQRSRGRVRRLASSRARTDLGILRDWLGTDTRDRAVHTCPGDRVPRPTRRPA